jgi:hypothetical protein
MPTTERVTVTLPIDLLEGIDRFEHNRSRFIVQAVERELVRRRREGLALGAGPERPGPQMRGDRGSYFRRPFTRRCADKHRGYADESGERLC